MLNKIACSYYNAGAIAKNGDLYIWGSGSSGMLGLEAGTAHEIPKKFPLDKVSPYFKASHISMGPNHMAIIVTNRLLDEINPKLYLQEVFKSILAKHREWFQYQNWDLLKELNIAKHTHVTKDEFLQFIDMINEYVDYTEEEEDELFNFIDLFASEDGETINLAQYIYCLDPSYFKSDIVLTAGFNENGRLGTGEIENMNNQSRNTSVSEIASDEAHLNLALAKNKARIQELRPVSFDVPIIKVSCGHKFTIALDKSGELWSWGKGGDGCLGDGQLADRWSPGKVQSTYFGDTLDRKFIVDISAGAEHCLAINRTCEVFSWGKGTQGRLGHGSDVALLTPKKIEYFVKNGLKIISIYAGEQHSAAISEKKELYTWGCGDNYRLGHGTLYSCFKPELVSNIADRYIEQVSCGSMHTLALTSDGHIYAWGSGLNGRLGIDISGNNDFMLPTRIAPFSEEVKLKTFIETLAGPHQSFGLTDEGELLAWGSIKFKTLGIFGLKSDLNVPTPINLGEFKFYYEKKTKKHHNTNRIKFDSYDLAFQKRIKENNHPFEIARIFCGETNTIFLMANGDLYICGSGQYGQLCINPETKGEEFANDETALRELFIEGDMIYSYVPIFIPSNLETKFMYVAVGLNHIIAITIDGKPYTWGRNTEGQLGLASGAKYQYKPTPIEEVTGKKFVMCVASHTYSALLSDKGEVWVFGSAEYGCLGVSPNKQNYDIPVPKMINDIPKIKYIAGGPQHMAALDVNGELYVWGNGNNGRLGTEKNTTVLVPKLVSISDKTKFKQVTCGFMHTLLLDTEGHIWGAGAKAYAGFPSENAYKTLEEQNKFALIPDLKKKKFLHISSGEFHNLAVSVQNDVYGWGKTDYGKLAQASLVSSDNLDSRVRNVLLPRRVEKLEQILYVSAGVNHSACINMDNECYVWGAALMGRLGITRDEIKLLRNLDKMTKEMNVLSLHIPNKLQVFFEDELTRKLKIFSKNSEEEYGYNFINNATSKSEKAFTNNDSSENIESDEEGTQFIDGNKLKYRKFTMEPQQPSKNITKLEKKKGDDHSYENGDEEDYTNNKNFRSLREDSIEARGADASIVDRMNEPLADATNHYSSKMNLMSGQNLYTKQDVTAKSVRSVKSTKSVKSRHTNISALKGKNGESVANRVTTGVGEFGQPKGGLGVYINQLELQKELYADEVEYYETTLIGRDEDLNLNLQYTLKSIIKQVEEIKNKFAAEMMNTQSVMQTSLLLLTSKAKPLNTLVPTVPTFILQNIQLYEGIVSSLFSHPCYLYRLLKNGIIDQQLVMNWIFKIYKSDSGEPRVANLVLSLTLMLLEDEAEILPASAGSEIGVIAFYPKMYDYLVRMQECNHKFIKEIVHYLINNIIKEDYAKLMGSVMDLSNNKLRRSNAYQKELAEAAKHFYDLEYHYEKSKNKQNKKEFNDALERCLSVITRLESYLCDLLSQADFSVLGKISREVCYLNSRIIEEYKYIAEKKAFTENVSETVFNRNINNAVRDAGLLIINLFFGRISEYLVKYEAHSIKVFSPDNPLLAEENLASLGKVLTAYFQKTEIGQDHSYSSLNNYITTMSKKQETVKSLVRGLTAHDEFNLTLDNILRVVDDSLDRKDRFNYAFTVKDIIELQNSLSKLPQDSDIFIGSEQDPIFIMLSYLEFREYDISKFSYQVLQHRLNLKISSKILNKNLGEKDLNIHRCNFCNLVYPEHMMGANDLKLLKQPYWNCQCKENNNSIAFENKQCQACGDWVPEHLYQQRTIFKKYYPLVKKDNILCEYMDFIKSHSTICANDRIDEILARLIEWSLKEGDFEKSHKFTRIFKWMTETLTIKGLIEQLSLKINANEYENPIDLLNQILIYEFALRKKHKAYLDKAENLLNKLSQSIKNGQRKNHEAKENFDKIKSKVVVSHGKFNGLKNKTIKKASLGEELAIQEKLNFSQIKPFAIFTSEELKARKVLLSFVLHNKIVPKITTNLKFYFFYRESIGFHVRVVFLEDSWLNYLVKIGPWFTNEVGLDDFNISPEHLLELRRTAYFKAEVSLGYSTFSVENLAKLLDDVLVKFYYHIITDTQVITVKKKTPTKKAT